MMHFGTKAMPNHTLIAKQNIANGNDNVSFQVNRQMLTVLQGEPEYVFIEVLTAVKINSGIVYKRFIGTYMVQNRHV